MNIVNRTNSNNNSELLQEFFGPMLDKILKKDKNLLKHFWNSQESFNKECFEFLKANKLYDNIKKSSRNLEKLSKKIEFYSKLNSKSKSSKKNIADCYEEIGIQNKKIENLSEQVELELNCFLKEYISKNRIKNTVNNFKSKISGPIGGFSWFIKEKKEVIKQVAFATILSSTLLVTWVWAKYDIEKANAINNKEAEIQQIKDSTKQKINNIVIDPKTEEAIFYNSIPETNNPTWDYFSEENWASLKELSVEDVKVLFASIYWEWPATRFSLNFSDNSEKTKTFLLNKISLANHETWGHYSFWILNEDPFNNGIQNIWITQFSSKKNVLEKYIYALFNWIDYIVSSWSLNDKDIIVLWVLKQTLYYELEPIMWKSIKYNDDEVQSFYKRIEEKTKLSVRQLELIALDWNLVERTTSKFDAFECMSDPNISEEKRAKGISAGIQWWIPAIGRGVCDFQYQDRVDKKAIGVSRWTWRIRTGEAVEKIIQETEEQIKKDEEKKIEKLKEEEKTKMEKRWIIL